MKLETFYFSGIYQLKSEQIIAATLEDVWAFFSDPKNLDKITPKDMGFVITSKMLGNTYQGQIITYKIEILPKMTSFWVTEITHYKEHEFFVDEQRFGPYKMWHHEHHFTKTKDGNVKMTDLVSYKLPFGFLGRLLVGRIIKNKVKSIFENRFMVIDRYF